MNRFVILLLCAPLALTPQLLAQKDCTKIETESRRARCLEQRVEEADSRVSSLLETIVWHYSPQNRSAEDLSGTPEVKQVVETEDRLTIEALRKSQSNWLMYRDSACKAVGHSYEGGTASAQAIPACELQLTQERIKWLRANFSDALSK